MALIYTSKRKTCDNLFYRYYRIECFKYKGFSDFLSLLESGIIKAKIILRFARSGNDIGKNKNKNMCFMIIKRRVNKLFNRFLNMKINIFCYCKNIIILV